MDEVTLKLLQACKTAYFGFLVLPEEWREANRNETNVLRHAIAKATKQDEEDVDEYFETIAKEWLERSPF